MPFSRASGLYTRNEEPTLDELLAEPIVRLLMARDGVEEETVRRVFVAARTRLKHEAEL